MKKKSLAHLFSIDWNTIFYNLDSQALWLLPQLQVGSLPVTEQSGGMLMLRENILPWMGFKLATFRSRDQQSNSELDGIPQKKNQEIENMIYFKSKHR